jgi:hypothetical protein
MQKRFATIRKNTRRNKVLKEKRKGTIKIKQMKTKN